ncbi:MAG: ATP-binding protein [Lysobacterales bacterium]
MDPEELEVSDPEALPEHSAQRLQALDQLDDGVWIAEAGGELLYRNQVAARMERMFWSRSGLVGTMEDVVFNQDTLAQLNERGEWSAEFHLSAEEDEQERSVMLQMHRLPDASGLVFHARDVSREWLREQALQDRHIELEQAYSRLKETQTQLLQSEKMASIGQLAAGVAHEINNPIGYVHSNLGTLQTYLRGLMRLLDAYEQPGQAQSSEQQSTIDAIKREIDYGFMREDLPALLLESREGIERVKKIVLDLRDFSHGGQSDVDEWMQADVHRGLESTLNIVWNEIKYKAEVRKEFGVLPLIACIPSQLNQVFLNLLINAGQAISERGVITIRTAQVGAEVCIAISDTGIGIPPENLKRIFDPFFTTKAVGKGTGLGLSLSYGIVQKHHGRIEVDSHPGEGTTFRVYLPIHRHIAES